MVTKKVKPTNINEKLKNMTPAQQKAYGKAIANALGDQGRRPKGKK